MARKPYWGAHAARVLVAAASPQHSSFAFSKKVRDREDTITSTRAACAPRKL
jgi:hypothetical protein